MHCKKCWFGIPKRTKRNADLEGCVEAEYEERGIMRNKRRGIRRKKKLPSVANNHKYMWRPSQQTGSDSGVPFKHWAPSRHTGNQNAGIYCKLQQTEYGCWESWWVIYITYWIIEEFEVQVDGPDTWDVIADANVLTMKGEAIKCCLCSFCIFTCTVLNKTPVLWTAIFQSNLFKTNRNVTDSQTNVNLSIIQDNYGCKMTDISKQFIDYN